MVTIYTFNKVLKLTDYIERLKNEVAQHNDIEVSNLKKVILIKDAAEYLGVKASKVRRLIASGVFSIVRIEHKIYIKIASMEYYKRKYFYEGDSSNNDYISQAVSKYLIDEQGLIERIDLLTEEVEKLRAQLKENSFGKMFITKVCKAVLMTKAAEILSCPVAKIRRLIKTGELEGVTIGGKQYVTVASLVKIQSPM